LDAIVAAGVPRGIADPLTADQRGRGFPRQSGPALDIGAYEHIVDTVISLDNGNLLISDTATEDVQNTLTIQSDTTHNVFVISDLYNPLVTSIPGAVGSESRTVTVPFADVSGTINISAGNGVDSLVVDLSRGAFSHVINYDGGSQRATGTLMVIGNVTGTFASADVPKAIPDNPTISSDLVVAATGTVADVNVALDISHTWREDLDVFLIGPVVTLVEVALSALVH